MSLWSRFPFVRITSALIGGILTARHWEGLGWGAWGLLGCLLLTYVLVTLLVSPAAFHTWGAWLGLLGLGSIFLLGYLRFGMSQVHRDPNHLQQWAALVEAYEVLVLEDPHEQADRNNVIVAVNRARVRGVWQRVQGKVRLSLPSTLSHPVRYGDVLLIQGQPRAVLTARNPYEFDYATFLGLSQVYHSHFVTEGEMVLLAHRPLSLLKVWSYKALHYCQVFLAQYIHAPEARAVVLALVLGQKDALTPAVRAAYAGTGTMHVLAVSGLHVGILYWFLSLLIGVLKPTQRIQWLSPLVSVALLWFYACLTGLSPSVLRATIMFTLVAVAPLLGRQSNIYNTLAASAFLLLYWNPLLLFTVGFQLSYLAVLGIVYLQPRIYRGWSLRSRFLDKLWLLTSVSLAAQLATAPISLYYFHQFPTYFIVANWVVVPAVSVILCLGLVVLLTSFWPSLSVLLTWLLEAMTVGVNAFIEGIQKLPYSIIDRVVLTTPVVVLLYSLLILWLVFLHTRRLRYLMTMSMVALLLSWYAVRSCLEQQAQRRVIFYSIKYHQAVAFIRGRQSVLCIDERFKASSRKYDYHVQPSQAALGITSSVSYTLREAAQRPEFPLQTWQGLHVLVWHGQKFIFLGDRSSPLPSFASKVHTDFLVIENNVVTELQPLLDRFDFKMLVIGTSNTQSLTEQLQSSAASRGIHSHSLLKQGALTLLM